MPDESRLHKLIKETLDIWQSAADAEGNDRAALVAKVEQFSEDQVALLLRLHEEAPRMFRLLVALENRQSVSGDEVRKLIARVEGT